MTRLSERLAKREMRARRPARPGAGYLWATLLARIYGSQSHPEPGRGQPKRPFPPPRGAQSPAGPSGATVPVEKPRWNSYPFLQVDARASHNYHCMTRRKHGQPYRFSKQ